MLQRTSARNSSASLLKSEPISVAENIVSEMWSASMAAALVYSVAESRTGPLTLAEGRATDVVWLLPLLSVSPAAVRPFISFAALPEQLQVLAIWVRFSCWLNEASPGQEEESSKLKLSQSPKVSSTSSRSSYTSTREWCLMSQWVRCFW